MSDYFLRNWNKNKFYLFNERMISPCAQKDVPSVVEGVLKIFVSGPTIILYKSGGIWKINLAGDTFMLEKIETINLKRIFPFIRIRIGVDGRYYNCLDYAGSDFLARGIDPTYDCVDRELVFGYWLKDLIATSCPPITYNEKGSEQFKE